MPLFLNIKQKWKHRILWNLHIIQKSPLLKTRQPHFSLVWLMECSIYISMFGLSQRFFDISSLPILVVVQLLQENGKWILYVSNGAKWLSVCLQTKLLWNKFLLQLLKLQISRLLREGARDGSRAAATSKMERFVVIVNGFQPLTVNYYHKALHLGCCSSSRSAPSSLTIK